VHRLSAPLQLLTHYCSERAWVIKRRFFRWL
jgi:hypothetical protein